MWDIMGKICERAQDNLWGLYGKYLQEPKLGNNMENIWVIYRKYVRNIHVGPKQFMGLYGYFLVSGLMRLGLENLYLNNFIILIRNYEKKIYIKRKHSKFE